MPDGNVPSSPRSSTADGTRAPSPRRATTAQKTSAANTPPPAPADRLTRLDALRKQLIEARSLSSPLTELLQAYDAELHAIAQETQKNGGLSPLSFKEQEELRRVEEERESLANSREDDPRARARTIAKQLKRVSADQSSANFSAALKARQETTTSPSDDSEPSLATNDLEKLRLELDLLKDDVWQNNLTRELNRNEGATIDDLERALAEADRITQETPAPVASNDRNTVVEKRPEDLTDTSDDTPETDSGSEATTEPEPTERPEQTERGDTSTQPNSTIIEAAATIAAPVIAAAGISSSVSSPITNKASKVPSEEVKEPSAKEVELQRLNARLSAIVTTLANRREALLQSDETLQQEVAALEASELSDDQRAELLKITQAITAHKELASRLGKTALTPHDEDGRKITPPIEQVEDIQGIDLAKRRDLLAALETNAIKDAEALSQEQATLLKRVTAASSAVRLTASVESTIAEARQELRAKYIARLDDQKVVTLYQERMRERSWNYLQTQDPTRFQQLQSIQTRLNTQIDPSTTLPEHALESIHLQAIHDIRLQFPEITDAAFSAILLRQANAQCTAAAAIQAGISAATLEQVVQQSAAASAAIGVAALFAGVTGANLLDALTKQREASESIARQLADEEQRIIKRAETLKTANETPAQHIKKGTLSTSGLESESLRQAQRESANGRRRLQAKIGTGLQQLQSWNKTLAAGAAGAGIDSTSLVLLAVANPNTFRLAASAKPSNTTQERSASSRNEPTLNSARQEASEQKISQRDSGPPPSMSAADQQAKAAHLQSLKARAKIALPSTTQGARPSDEPPEDRSTAGIEQPPLLALSSAPKTRQEAFARRQHLMNRERDQFIGTQARGSGYEATFGLTAPLPEGGVEPDPNGQQQGPLEVNEQDILDEQIARSELLRQQQLATRQQENGEGEQESGKPGSALNAETAQRLQQAAKLLRGAGGMSVGAVLAAILVVVLIVWLNIRLIFPNPESSWRKPLGTMGVLGTIALDLLVVLITIVQFLLFILLLLLPLAIIFLPGLLLVAILS